MIIRGVQCAFSNDVRRLVMVAASGATQHVFADSAMRSMSSAAPAAKSAGESIAISGRQDTPLLVRLPQRQWGPSVKLPVDAIKAISGGKAASRIAVVRDSFAASDQQPRPFSMLFRSLPTSVGSSVAALGVATELASPATRALVDEYELSAASGEYHLKHVGVDVLRFLRQMAVQAVLLPDINTPRPNHLTGVIGAGRGVRQSSNSVLMVAPTSFGFNEQAATDNSFMQKPGEGVTRQVLKEFASLHHQLTEVAGVKVELFEHSLSHGTPDACFPNNWFSTHPAGEAAGGVQKGTLVLYPMKHPNRAAERRDDAIAFLRERGYQATYDMTGEEAKGRFFEGTGVLVIDRVNGVAYVALSERADATLARQWVERMGYKDLVTFSSHDLRGKTVYHTNVMMAIGTDVAIVCAESVKDERERKNLLAKLRATHAVVEITLQQMDALCGNALEVQDGRGLPVLAMSTQAYNAFTEDQRRVMRRHVADIVHAPIDTLERVGGGGVRCCLAELF